MFAAIFEVLHDKRNRMEKNYLSRNHSKFLIKYHIIFVCKYRKQVLRNRQVDEDMKQILFDIANESDFDIEVMGPIRITSTFS